MSCYVGIGNHTTFLLTIHEGEAGLRLVPKPNGSNVGLFDTGVVSSPAIPRFRLPQVDRQSPPRIFDVRIPLWLVFLLSAAPAAWLWLRALGHTTAIYRETRGLCSGCGYDLRGNVSGRCPECGKETKKQPRRRQARYRNILLAYLCPVLLITGCLLTIGAPSNSSLLERVGTASAVSLGLISWFAIMTRGSMPELNFLCLCLAAWPLWLILVCRTGLRELPIIIHIGAVLAWCLAGLCLVNLLGNSLFAEFPA